MHSRIATATVALALLSLATPGACQGIWTNATGLPLRVQVKSMHILPPASEGGVGILSTADSQQYMTETSWYPIASTPNVQQVVMINKFNGAFAVTRAPSGNNTTVIMRWWAWQQTGQYHKEGGWARADPGHTSSGGNGYVVQSIECRSGHVAWAFGWVTWNGSLTNANGIAEQRVWRSRLEGTWEVEKVIRAPLATAPPSTWIDSLSAFLGFSGGEVWRSGAWIAYGAGGRVDRFEEGSGYRPDAFRQQRWGQPGDRVRGLLALPALNVNRGPRCMALVETGGPGAEPLKQTLLLWNGAAWVKKHETASPDQRLFSLTGSATTLGTTNTYFLAVLESQPYGARLLELRNLAPAFTEAARFECAPGIDCSPLDLRTAHVDVLSSAWAVTAGLVPAGSGAQLLTSLARVGGVWRPGTPMAVPATELAGMQGTPPWPYLFTVATRDLGVVYANGGAFPPPQ